MKKFAAFLTTLMVLLGACACAQEETDNQCALWRVQNGDVTVYLLGSIHVGNPDMYPFDARVTDAMAKADEFVFECDTTSGDAMVATQLAMVYTDGTRLEDVIGQELFDKAVRACEAVGLTSITNAMNAYKPWTVMNMLSLGASAIQLGTDDATQATTYGVETQMREILRGDTRPVSYLEKTTDQLELMDGFSLELQKFLLSDSCDVILHPEWATDNPLRLWAGWWKSGDTDSFAKSYLEGYLSPEHEAECLEYHDKLVTKRNIVMADGVESLLKGGSPRTYFVTVGLLHLSLPDDSVVKVLSDRGYAVERVR